MQQSRPDVQQPTLCTNDCQQEETGNLSSFTQSEITAWAANLEQRSQRRGAEGLQPEASASPSPLHGTHAGRRKPLLQPGVQAIPAVSGPQPQLQQELTPVPGGLPALPDDRKVW